MTKEEAIYKFSRDPETIGEKHRNWWIVEELKTEEIAAGASIGDLCVLTRDGDRNPIDTRALRLANFIGTSECTDDPNFRHYYFRPTRWVTKPSLYFTLDQSPEDE